MMVKTRLTKWLLWWHSFYIKPHGQPRKKRGKQYQAKPDNSYCGLPAVNSMALTERKGANSESGKELLQNQGVSMWL